MLVNMSETKTERRLYVQEKIVQNAYFYDILTPWPTRYLP